MENEVVMDIVALSAHSGRLEWTVQLLEELNKLPQSVLICFWDSGSKENIAHEVEKRFSRVWVNRSDKNMGFNGGYNAIAEMVEKESYGLFIKIDSDTLVRSHWYERTKECVGSWIGVAGTLYPSRADHADILTNRVNPEWANTHPGWSRLLFAYVQGGFSVFPKERVSRFGLFNKSMLRQHNDVETSLMLRSWGYELVGLPFVRSRTPTKKKLIPYDDIKSKRILVVHSIKEPVRRRAFLRRSTK